MQSVIENKKYIIFKLIFMMMFKLSSTEKTNQRIINSKDKI